MAYGYDDRPQYISLMDMIDGGGAGRSGDRFEGGGLLSLLANELFRPRGYEDRLRQRKNDTGRAVSTVVDELTKRRDARNLDRVDAYNRAEADRQAAAALMDERFNDTILAPGQGGLRRRLPQNQPATGMTYDYGGNRPMLSNNQPTVEEMGDALGRKLGSYNFMLWADKDDIKKLYEQHVLGMTYPSPTASIVPEVPVKPAPMRQPATGMTYNLMEGQEFADFMKLQRDLEQEMGLEPMTVESIHNMFKTWKSRGY